MSKVAVHTTLFAERVPGYPGWAGRIASNGDVVMHEVADSLDMRLTQRHLTEQVLGCF